MNEAWPKPCTSGLILIFLLCAYSLNSIHQSIEKESDDPTSGLVSYFNLSSNSTIIPLTFNLAN